MNLTNEIWVEKYRPQNLDELIMNEKDKTFFESLTRIPNNLLFIGKPGGGKTSLAKILAKKFAPESYLYINASDNNGIDTVRNDIVDFISVVSMNGDDKIVILNEVDFFSASAQAALRGIMEDYLNDVRFILTGNFKHKLTDALLSRCQTFEFKPNINDVVKRIVYILNNEKIKIADDQKKNLMTLIKRNFPDIRLTINELQKACSTGHFEYLNFVDNSFATSVYNKIKIKEDIFDIRKYVIENSENDFLDLMKKLFELYVKECNIQALLLISEHIYRDTFVLDKEINFSALLFNLSKI